MYCFCVAVGEVSKSVWRLYVTVQVNAAYASVVNLWVCQRMVPSGRHHVDRLVTDAKAILLHHFFVLLRYMLIAVEIRHSKYYYVMLAGTPLCCYPANDKNNGLDSVRPP